MKKWLLLLLAVVMFSFGCNTFTAEDMESRVGEFIEEPPRLIRDPHFAKYEKDRDALEHLYFAEEISYVEYTQKKKALEDKYNKEVEERNNIVIQGGY